jgi:putative heme-binding domain-containing protein
MIALGLAGSPQGGEKLLAAVAAGKASARLLQEPAIGIRLDQAKIANLAERVAALTKGLPTADQRVQDLLGRRRDGYHNAHAEPGVGLKVFEKHCAACHQIANKGAKIGPQLDGVGIRGLERLLEDTLDPNRNVDQAFRTTTLVLTSGQIVNGLLLRQDGTVLVMADSAGKEVRVPAADVQERLLSPLSPMPGNFAELIPEDDFYHLLAYLLAQRTKE